ncbi:MAG: 3-oxoacyl-ACP reductase FabG [Clostridiales bacterium]|nr:3-oxoacyl-ACP reductase FabG [Clostridiales bacterium]
MLNGKVAVVTGGSRGIGRALCISFAKAGADVAFLCRRDSEEAAATREEAGAAGVRCEKYICDVSDFDGVKAAFEKITADFGTVDILVNNAGVTCDKLLLSMKPEEFDRVIKTNLYGTFNAIKQVYPIFCRKRSGRIINISSVSGIIGNAGQANYSASKAGVIALTKSIAKELGPRNVTCNAIAPGFVETDMTAAFADSEEILKSIPIRRFARPEEIASLAVYLAGDDAACITGSVFTADGGLTCR